MSLRKDKAMGNLRKKRTNVNWSKHELIVKSDSLTKIWELKKPNTYTGRVVFINSCGVMSVTGDYGNWIFCREFHPSLDGYVSDCYWCEKLRIGSTQSDRNYDASATMEEIEKQLNGGLEDEGYEGEKLKTYKDYLETCLEHVDEEIDYNYHAFSYDMPDFLTAEDVIRMTKMPFWLEVIFDAFEEVCRRLGE